jgi:hypothetical protein
VKVTDAVAPDGSMTIRFIHRFGRLVCIHLHDGDASEGGPFVRKLTYNEAMFIIKSHGKAA